MSRVGAIYFWGAQGAADPRVGAGRLPGYVDDTTLMAESEELKSLLMKAKEESEKV